MKFKIGDKVKILLSATSVGVEREDVGKIGVIHCIRGDAGTRRGIQVQMSEICKARGHIPKWNVGSEMLELLPVKNQQLLFNFMN